MKLFSNLTELTSATGQAVSRTVGNVTAGVGRVGNVMVPDESALQAAPEVVSFSSEEAHQRYKAYNTDFNLHLNKLREWNGYLSSAVFWLMASAMAIATKGVILENSIQFGALIAGVTSAPFLAVAATTLVLGAVKMGISQYITKVQTEKGMDVSDFHIKREAELVGQEVSKHMEGKGQAHQAQQEAAHHVSSAHHEGGLQDRALQAGVTYH